MRLFLWVCLIEFVVVASLPATVVNWRSRVVPMDGLSGAIQAELGSFGSFTPTRGNTAQWLQNWKSVDSTRYDAERGLFASSVNVTTPLTGPAYVWLADYLGNWALLTNANWDWPAVVIVGPPPPFPEDFFTTQAGTVAVLGSFTPDSSTEHLGTEVVNALAHPSIYAGWLRDQGLSDDPVDPGEDADGDGFSNLEEYARGGDPNVAGDLSFFRLELGSESILTLPGLINPQVQVELITSVDLKTWELANSEIVSVDPDFVVKALEAGPRRFFSLRYSLLSSAL